MLSLFLKHIISSFLILLASACIAQGSKAVVIIQNAGDAPRITYGVQHLADGLKKIGYQVKYSNKFVPSSGSQQILISEWDNKLNDLWKSPWRNQPSKEGFIILTDDSSNILIQGHDASGILYACMELEDRATIAGKLPDELQFRDAPEMVMRGTCIGLQKPYYLPGRGVYEYPYTPKTFPWFYNKQLWIQYLDSMVKNRMNSLYLWNGHPFASLVRLKDYPYAVEVDDATFKKNEDIYRFLATEADKRGIWVIQMFYNIIVSKPFAEKNRIKTQDRSRHITPLIADYTRKSIAAFVAKYPNVGLMVCLGEAMEGVGQDDIDWFTKTIIPGVQDGLKILGKTEEPPIVLRAHDTDAPAVMKAALPLYKNLYTEAKFNGEALTTYEPRGSWAELHRTLSRLGSVQIENVHIMANLEPFRYGAVDFIQKSVQGMHSIMEGNGLHLYPQASYWDWPYSADSVKGKRLLQMERDWIWYAAWGRYAWKAGRDSVEESKYWSHLLGLRYGLDDNQGENVLKAYEQSGEIAPKLLRRFGITDGNRQTLTLGMLMTQLINPDRYGLFTLLYESESPEGESLAEYVRKEWFGEKHTGETPNQIIDEVREHGFRCVRYMEYAGKTVTKNKEEFQRLKNDMYCYKALADHYAAKAQAAIYVLRYKYSNDIRDLDNAYSFLNESMIHYRNLVKLTEGTYLYANSMQTAQRKIPIRGVDGTFKTWKEVAVPFEAELKHFKRAFDSLRRNQFTVVKKASLLPADVQLQIPVPAFRIDSGSVAFSDTSLSIIKYAGELKGLKGIQFSFHQQASEETPIRFSNEKPVELLVGYFKSKEPVFLKPPELETNANANDRGQADIKIANAIVLKGMPPVNIHRYHFAAGKNELVLPKGVCLVLGFIDGQQLLHEYDAGLYENGNTREVDWLFE